MMRAPQIFGAPAPVIPNLWGISAEGVGVIGLILNFVVAYLVSRATPPPPDHIQHLVEDIRIPKGAGQAAEH